MSSKSKKPVKKKAVKKVSDEPIAEDGLTAPMEAEQHSMEEQEPTAEPMTEPVEPIEEPDIDPLVHESVPPETTSEPEVVQTVELQEPNATEPIPGNTPFTRIPAVRDPRLPPVGSVIQRTYKGTILEVTVQESGFEFNGQKYSSLSSLAKEITGHKAINGFAFFRLNVTGGKSTAARLQNTINKIEKAVVKLKAVLEDGFETLTQSQEQLAVLKDKVKAETTPTD